MDFDIEKLNASFEQFNGLPGNVLVVGANSNANHYRMAIQSILDRNPKNGEKILQITESEAGLYAVITINVMDESADGDHALHEKKKRLSTPIIPISNKRSRKRMPKTAGIFPSYNFVAVRTRLYLVAIKT